jgi:hypothetical protein
MEVTHVVVECVALLLRIHQVPVQMLARKSTLLTKVICGFLQSLQSNSGISQNNATVAPFHISQSLQYIIINILSLRQYCRTLSTAVHLIYYMRFVELALLPSLADWLSQGTRSMSARARVNGTKWTHVSCIKGNFKLHNNRLSI